MSQGGIIHASSGTTSVNQVVGSNGVTASPTTGNVVVSGVNATTSSVGVASFDSTYFSVSGAGKVTFNGSTFGTTITGNDSVALSPSAGNWNIVGGSTSAGSTPIVTSGSGSTLTVKVQAAQALASTDVTKIGAALFNSAQFTVDSNGFVSAKSTAIPQTLTGNSGGAVSPTASNINIVGTGSLTVVGNPGTSTLTAQLTGLTNHAVLVGAGTATITSVGPSSTSGQILQSQGASSDPAFSTATYPSTTSINQILYSSANNVVSGLATANNGVLTTGTSGTPVITALNSNGGLIIGSASGAPAAAMLTAGTGVTITNEANSITISSNGSVIPQTLTGNSGGAVGPSAGNINTVGAGSITVVGSPGTNTTTTQLTGLTQYNVLTGQGTSTIGLIAPSATSGVPLVSQGSSAYPAFGTAVVAGGGTGNTSFSAYQLIAGGTTSTGALQQVSGTGTSGQILVSQGAGALPQWQNLSATSLTITSVNHAASPYTVLSTDQYLAVDTSGGVVTINMPNTMTTGRVVYIKDSKGTSSTSAITVTTPGGTVTFDGSTSYTIAANYTSNSLVFDGTNYQIF